jgi:hypothetical protein
LRGIGREQLGGAIRRPVVDDDDLERRPVELEHALDGLDDDALLVVRRYQHADERVLVELVEVAAAALASPGIDQASRDPVQRRQQGYSTRNVIART